MHLFARIQMRRAAVAVLSLSLSIPSAFVPFALLRTDRRTSHARSLLSRTLTHSKNAYAFGNADTSMLLSLSLSLFQARFHSSSFHRCVRNPKSVSKSSFRRFELEFRNREDRFERTGWNFELFRTIDHCERVARDCKIDRRVHAV